MTLAALRRMRVTSPTLRRDLLDAVPRFIEIEQGTRALRLFERMNITALKIFTSCASSASASLSLTMRNGCGLGQLRGAGTTGSSYDLEAPFG